MQSHCSRTCPDLQQPVCKRTETCDDVVGRVCENVDSRRVCDIVSKDVCRDVEVERCSKVEKVVCESVAKPRTVEKREEKCDCRKKCKNVIKKKKCGLGQALVPKTGPTVTTTEKTLPRTRTWTEHGPWKKVTNSSTKRLKQKSNILDSIRTFFHETLPNKFKINRS